MKNVFLLGIMLLCLNFALKAQTVGPDYIKNSLTAQGVFNAPNFEFTNDYDSYNSHANIQGLFMEGLDYFGNPTKVFCWYGVPETLLPGETAPAVVLMHGGGGNAFTAWVKKWTDRGYIAISIALEGQVPDDDPNWAYSGPERLGFFNTVLDDLSEQWFYHAVADGIMANSLLRTFSEVDANNIGINGISWGGILTNVVSGIDNRFAFSIPVYGCGYLDTTPLYGGILNNYSADKRNAYLENWEPSLYVPLQNMPTLFVNGTNDNHFTMNAFTSNYKASNNEKYLRIQHNMPHGHGAGWNPVDIYDFADYITKGAEKTLAFTNTTLSNRTVTYQYEFAGIVDEAVLYYTTDTLNWRDNYSWTGLSATLDMATKTATAQIPDDALAYFMNINEAASNTIHSSMMRTIAPIVNTYCDDADPCTIGETFDPAGTCAGGIFQDSDNDGICDANDPCPDQATDACLSTTILDEINTETYENSKDIYNYTYWSDNLRNTSVEHKFNNVTETYIMSINYEQLSIHNLSLNPFTLTPNEAYEQLDNITNTNPQSGDINYAILQNGAVIHEKTNTPTNKSGINSYTQLPEFGKWCNRRMIDSINYTNNASYYGRFTGIEFTNWHDRFKTTYHFKPRTTITNGQLQFSIDIPTEYSHRYTNGTLYGFANAAGEGFALKPGITTGIISINNNTITITGNQMDLIADTSYDLSLIFYPMNDAPTGYLSAGEKEAQINITATQTLPSAANVTNINYDEDEGTHFVTIPRYTMGYSSCGTAERLQNIEFSLENTTNTEKRVRLCIQQTPATNVVGFSSMLRNNNGDPSGHHLQVSKNWHGSYAGELYGGSQIKEYTELIIPANTTLNFDYTRVGAKWGETYAASSHQLSIVGYSAHSGQQWLEAALGSSGESVCHSPDYIIGNTNTTDWRPFLVTNQAYAGGTSSECSWTGNVGGIDFSRYQPSGGSIDTQSEGKTKFRKYGPNLSETSINFYSSDKKIRTQYTFYLNRSDDFNRVYYKVEVEALEDVAFDRFDFFQLGGDSYRYYSGNSIAYGNEDGVLGTFAANNTSATNGYTTNEIALTGNNAWVWAGDGERRDQSTAGINIPTNNGFVVRDFAATYNGVADNTPYLRERNSTIGGRYPTSYCLVTPPSVNSFTAGDKIEFTAEAIIFPKQIDDYYGPNQNFIDALTTYGNSWEMLHREAAHNAINATSQNNVVDLKYPLSVQTINNTADVTITGGTGYIPVVFKGLTDITNPQLWKAENDCWELVDQSTHGKDFWQVEYDETSGLFDLIYNVNQDIANDDIAVIKYYLGDNPPVPNIIVQTQIVGNSWSLNPDVVAVADEENVRFAPQVNIGGNTSQAVNANWLWTKPDGSTKIGRVLDMYPVTIADEGAYTVTYDNGFGCVDTTYFSLSLCPELDLHANLEGAYDAASGEMTTGLNTRGLLPGQTPLSNLATPTPTGQPYSTSPWNYAGTEGADWTDADYTGDETDWVLVSFRTGTAKNTEVAMTAALLNKDGSMIFPKRCALMPVEDALYIVVEHRNHIGIMTPQPIDIIGSTLTYDFRLSDSYRDITSFGQKQLSTGEWSLFAGDANQSDFPSFDINGTDKTLWFDNNGVFDYYFSPDFNLDGDINGEDKSLWFDNNGISSRVPK